RCTTLGDCGCCAALAPRGGRRQRRQLPLCTGAGGIAICSDADFAARKADDRTSELGIECHDNRARHGPSTNRARPKSPAIEGDVRYKPKPGALDAASILARHRGEILAE